MLKPSCLAPFRFLGIACLCGVALVACTTDSTSLGSAGKLDASPSLDSGSASADVAKAVDLAVPVDVAKLVDAVVIVDAPVVVDTVVLVDTTKPVDTLVPVDTAKPVDSGEVMCVANGVSYKPGEIITISACGTCACLADGTLGRCTGVCMPDAAPLDAPRDTVAPDTTVLDTKPVDAEGLSALCTSTGGQLGQSLCCGAVGDFPNTCLTGACGCAPASSHTIATCTCLNGGCFDPSYGCSGPTGICTVGADQTCNDNLAISSIHGRCLEGGRCVCTGTYKLLTSGKCS